SPMYASDGVIMKAIVTTSGSCSATADAKLQLWPASASANDDSDSPRIIIRRAPNRSARWPTPGCSMALSAAATPNSRPIRAGPIDRLARWSASTGSSIDIVADAATTAIVQTATAGTRSTVFKGTASCSLCAGGRSISRNEMADTTASPVTNRNGSRIPPISYSQPPIDGPIMKAKLVPDITTPVTRPRSSAAYRSAISAKPTTQVIASAAPWTSRATNSTGSEAAEPKRSVAAASATSPPTIGARRPMRSDTAPIGTDTVSSVTPNDANRNPIIVGDAPSRRLKSGSTGTAIE